MPTMHTPAAGSGIRSARARRRERDIPFDLEVVDRSGHAVGELFDIMVDMDSGKIAYGVIELRNGRTNGSSRRIAVPWSVLYPDRVEDRLLIDAHRQRIERAPDLPPPSCSRRETRQWAKVVDDYFDALPHWEDALH